MSTGPGSEALAAQGEELAQAYASMRADPDLQFTPVTLPEVAPPPDWLGRLLAWLGELFAPVARGLVSGWPVIKWVLVALAAAMIAYLLWRLFSPIAKARRGEAEGEPGEDAWRPGTRVALALLEEADRLAAEHRYDEATHLLLQRSVGQIASARPDLFAPSSTARELAAEPALPDSARQAFAVLAGLVERSLFALRTLGQDDWQAARKAYADFALARLGQAA